MARSKITHLSSFTITGGDEMQDKLLPGRLAARLLGVSGTTVCTWVRQGRLAGFIDGKVCRVWESSVLEKTGGRQKHGPARVGAKEAKRNRALTARHSGTPAEAGR
jgi:hypothetical protein